MPLLCHDVLVLSTTEILQSSLAGLCERSEANSQLGIRRHYEIASSQKTLLAMTIVDSFPEISIGCLLSIWEFILTKQ